jgi:Family of unknown function (DUF6361)
VPTAASWWHNGLIDPPGDWPEAAKLTLRTVEAEYLRERIRERCAGTLLAVLAERRRPWEPVEFAWQLELPEIDGDQRRLLDHAHCFSEVMHGAALLYNLALAKATEDAERTEHYAALLEQWTEAEARAGRSAWSLPEVWVLLGEIGSWHSARTRAFVESWVRLARDPERVAQNAAALEMVRDREREVKGRKARLSFDAAAETWRGAAGSGQLEYRWASTQRQLLDIITARDA